MRRRVSSPVLVGRQDEVDTLTEALAAAARHQPSLTLVAGEAGVGKTRVVREAARRIHEQGALALRGECLELKGGEFPYAPIVAVLRQVGHPVIGRALERLPPGGREELARLVPELAVPDRASVSSEASPFAQGRLYELLLALLRAIGEEAPALVVIEDAHWADASTRDLLAFLVRNLASERVALVVTYRPDALGRDHPLRELLGELIRCEGVSRLTLERLGRLEVQRQLEAILGNAVDEPVVEEVFARSQGNPFFAEELFAAQLDGSGGELPESLRDALLARVQGLSEKGLLVVQALALVGRPVAHELLGAVTGLREPALSRALREAVADHVVLHRGDGETFEFRHALVREAVCADLMPGERTLLHRAIAEALVSGRDASAAELAYHWEAAGACTDALTATIDAGLEAEAIYAYGQAREHFDRALRLWDAHGPGAREPRLDRVELLDNAAAVARCTGDWDRALALSREALDLVDPEVEPRRAAARHERLGEYHFWDDEAALACYADALRLLPAGCEVERARIVGAQALALHYLRRWEQAQARAEEALELATGVGARSEEAYARLALGIALAFRGDAGRGEAQLRLALELALELGESETIARAYAHVAEALRLQGRVAEALALTLEGEQAAARMGLSESFGRAMGVIAAEDLLRLGAGMRPPSGWGRRRAATCASPSRSSSTRSWASWPSRAATCCPGEPISSRPARCANRRRASST